MQVIIRINKEYEINSKKTKHWHLLWRERIRLYFEFKECTKMVELLSCFLRLITFITDDWYEHNIRHIASGSPDFRKTKESPELFKISHNTFIFQIWNCYFWLKKDREISIGIIELTLNYTLNVYFRTFLSNNYSHLFENIIPGNFFFLQDSHKLKVSW